MATVASTPSVKLDIASTVVSVEIIQTQMEAVCVSRHSLGNVVKTTDARAGVKMEADAMWTLINRCAVTAAILDLPAPGVRVLPNVVPTTARTMAFAPLKMSGKSVTALVLAMVEEFVMKKPLAAKLAMRKMAMSSSM